MKKSDYWGVATCIVVAVCGTGATNNVLAGYIETGVSTEIVRSTLTARSQTFFVEDQPPERLISSPSRNISDISTAGFSKTSKDHISQFINQAVQSGKMEASVAAQILRSLFGSDFTSVPVQAVQQAPIENAVSATSELKAKPVSVTDWEILQTDGTLQNTLARWGEAANWRVHWNDVPEIKNPGYIKLPDRDFISAADYVLSKAKVAAKAAGIDVSIKAYSNRVLVISKEVK